MTIGHARTTSQATLADTISGVIECHRLRSREKAMTRTLVPHSVRMLAAATAIATLAGCVEYPGGYGYGYGAYGGAGNYYGYGYGYPYGGYGYGYGYPYGGFGYGGFGYGGFGYSAFGFGYPLFFG